MRARALAVIVGVCVVMFFLVNMIFSQAKSPSERQASARPSHSSGDQLVGEWVLVVDSGLTCSITAGEPFQYDVALRDDRPGFKGRETKHGVYSDGVLGLEWQSAMHINKEGNLAWEQGGTVFVFRRQ